MSAVDLGIDARERDRPVEVVRRTAAGWQNRYTWTPAVTDARQRLTPVAGRAPLRTAVGLAAPAESE
jgi:hypothetical protein